MRTAIAVALALMLAIPQTSFSEGISQDDSGMAKTANFEWTGDRSVDQPAALSPEDVCWANWQGTISGVANGWYAGGEYFATYQDPSETGCTNTYPFNVTDVQLVFRNPAGGVGNLTTPLQAVVYSVDLSNPTCPKPGVVLGRGALTPFNIGDNSWKTAQLTVDVCVNGPYFAGVYCPERIGGSSLDPGISSPAASPFGLRACASYNNYQGSWEDLVTEHGWVGNLVLISGGYSSNENSCTDCPTVIPEGYDLWQSSRDGRILPDYPFFGLGMPLPPDFFGPGSDPFDGIITDLQGQPLETEPPGILGQTDMIIKRLDPITIPAPGSPPQTVDVEIVALNLVSMDPITVTYNGGQNPELWEVQVCLSNYYPSTGTMEIESWCCDGGVWNWHPLFVRSVFTFTRLSDGFSLTFDAPANGYPDLHLDTYEGRWSAAIDPPTIPDMVMSEGLVLVDHDCNPGTAGIELGQSSRFVLTGGLGEPWFPEPCSDDYCPVSNATGDEYISRVQIGSIDNATGGSSYSDYQATHGATMAAGIGYPFTITGTNTWGGNQWNMWIDWNNDFDFFDAGEEIGQFIGAGPYTGTIIPPYGSQGGSYRLRVRMGGTDGPCGPSYFDGETEDYRIDVLQDVCEASGSCDDVYIDRIDDAAGGPVIMMSGCDYYSDFFDQTHIILPKTLLINNPIPAPAFVGVWVDWNQDNDFDDASETIGATGQGEPGPRYHFAPLTKPAGTPSGEYRLRIAIDGYDLPEPCGTVSGEVEDYRVVVGGCCEGRVGDANGTGEYPDEVSLADIMLMVDVLFISNVCTKLPCPDEADVNQSGGPNPPQEACMDYLSLGDIMTLVDFLFITGPQNMTLPDCL